MATVEELEARVETLARRNAELEEAAAALEKQHERDVLRLHITAGAHAAGIHPAAIADVVEHAMRSGEWKMNSQGKLYRQSDGLPDVDTNGDYITPISWMRNTLRKTAPHFFVDDPQNAPGATTGVRNPWMPENWNLSDQGRLYAQDKVLAERLAAEAGSRVGATRPAR